jgi:FtsH-binding integral membrane protein
MQPDRYGSTLTKTSSREIDAGLRGYLNSIYARMAMGMLITAMVAYGMSLSDQMMKMISATPLKYAVMFAPVLVVMFGFNPMRMSSNALRLSFIAISVLYGVSFSTIFWMFNMPDIFRAFFVTAGAFAGLSLMGYTTRKNLDGLGSFASMGVFGVLILVVSNLFFQSSMLMNIISVVALVSFAGLTAHDTQRMKEIYHPSVGPEANSRMAWVSALSLYINFIGMFQSILYLMSGSRE